MSKFPKKNTRKSDCPYCKASSGSSHKIDCSEIKRLYMNKRVIKYNIKEIIVK